MNPILVTVVAFAVGAIPFSNIGAVGPWLAGPARPVLVGIANGSAGTLLGLAVAVPMLTKRMLGNRPPPEPRVRTMRNRLLFDRDDWSAA